MRRALSRVRSRAHTRQARLDRLRQNEGTLLDRLYGTAYESVSFPPPRDFEDGQAAETLRFVLHLGRELFLAGSSTRDIQTAVVAVTATWGMQNLEVDISGRSLQVQYAPPRRAPVVMLIVLGSEDTRDLSRLTALERLTVRIVATRLAPADARAALDRLVAAPTRWPWWFTLGGGAVLAAMLCVLASGTARAALPVRLTLVTSGIGALGNAVFMGGGPRLVPWAMAAALVGAGVKMFGMAQLDWSAPLATGLATTVMGAVSTAIGPPAGVPARAVLIPGIAGSVLPGPDLYRSMLQLVLCVPGAHQYVVTTLASVAAIGVGGVLGSPLGAGSERMRGRSPQARTSGAVIG